MQGLYCLSFELLWEIEAICGVALVSRMSVRIPECMVV